MKHDVMDHLMAEAEDLIMFLNGVGDDLPLYEVFEARLDHLKALSQKVDRIFSDNLSELREAQARFRAATDPVFQQGILNRRARTWPEGYPGDYLTLEGVYGHYPVALEGIGGIVDRYLNSRTLAVAVRSRLRTLARLLRKRAVEEQSQARWLNVACGPCRELLAVPSDEGRAICCLDTDVNALRYAEQLLTNQEPRADRITFVHQQAMRLIDPRRTIAQFGELTTIYSTGLFDYIETASLIRLLRGLYGALAHDGMLIAAFKDCQRYETFDYHWLSRWHFFYQRTEEEFRDIMRQAGVPSEQLQVERDSTGVILFFTARR